MAAIKEIDSFLPQVAIASCQSTSRLEPFFYFRLLANGGRQNDQLAFAKMRSNVGRTIEGPQIGRNFENIK